MKLIIIISIVAILCLLVDPSMGQRNLYSVSSPPNSELTFFDLSGNNYTFNFPLHQSFNQVHGIFGFDPTTSSTIDIIVSLDEISISILSYHFTYRNSSISATIPLPSGVSSNQLSSFSSAINNLETRFFFLSQVGDSVALNHVSIGDNEVTTLPLFNQPAKNIIAVQDTSGGSILVSAIINGDYCFFWVDLYENGGITKKAIITQADARPFGLQNQLFSINGQAYLVEYDAIYFRLSVIDWENQRIVTSNFIDSKANIVNFKLVFTNLIGVIIASSSSSQTNAYIFSSSNLNPIVTLTLPAPIPSDSVIYFSD